MVSTRATSRSDGTTIGDDKGFPAASVSGTNSCSPTVNAKGMEGSLLRSTENIANAARTQSAQEHTLTTGVSPQPGVIGSGEDVGAKNTLNFRVQDEPKRYPSHGLEEMTANESHFSGRIGRCDADWRASERSSFESHGIATGNVKHGYDEVSKRLTSSSERNGPTAAATKQSEDPRNESKPSDTFAVLAGWDPAKLFSRDSETSAICRKVIQEVYVEQSKISVRPRAAQQTTQPSVRRDEYRRLGPLVCVEVGRQVDSDQLWEELETRNKPLLSYIHRRVHRLQIPQAAMHLPEDSPDLLLHNSGDGKAGSAALGCEPQVGSVSRQCSESVGSAYERQLSPAFQEPQAKAFDEKESVTRRAVRFELDEKTCKNDEDTRGQKATAMEIDDGFFSLEDMERFADDAERLARAGKLAESDDDSSRGVAHNESTVVESSAKFRYTDFFDAPSPVCNQNVDNEFTLSTHRNINDDDSGKRLDDYPDTALSKAQARMRRTITAIEEENVSRRAWQLRGEATAASRPKDSLIETAMDHDTTLHEGAAEENEKNEKIEDIIRQRIIDKLFDDVVPVLPETYSAGKAAPRTGASEISQEKPSESLAEIYARDFVGEKERARNNSELSTIGRSMDTPETLEQKEVNLLYDKLVLKLDALSGLQIIPSTGKKSTEMMVSRSTKALVAEEAIPDAVSDISVLTPGEVFSVPRNTVKDPMHATKSERRAARGRRKRRGKLSREAGERAAELGSHSKPSAVEKRRAEVALARKGKKMRLVQAGRPGTKTDIGILETVPANPVASNVIGSASTLVL